MRLYGFDEIISFFKKANQKMHHAHILCGDDGVGKKTFAKIFAHIVVNNLEVNKENVMDVFTRGLYNVCDENITIIARDDVNADAKDGKAKVSIGVDEIRNATQRMWYKSKSLRKKFLIIEHAENLNYNAANSLLKILEEPRSDTYILLTTAIPSALLSTLRSRCVLLRTKRLKQYEFMSALQQLQNRYDVPQNSQRNDLFDIIYDLSNNSLQKALLILQHGVIDLIHQLQRYYNFFDQSISKMDRLELKNSIIHKIIEMSEDEDFDIYEILYFIPKILINYLKLQHKSYNSSNPPEVVEKVYMTMVRKACYYLSNATRLHLDLQLVLFILLDYSISGVMQ